VSGVFLGHNKRTLKQATEAYSLLRLLIRDSASHRAAPRSLPLKGPFDWPDSADTYLHSISYTKQEPGNYFIVSGNDFEASRGLMRRLRAILAKHSIYTDDRETVLNFPQLDCRILLLSVEEESDDWLKGRNCYTYPPNADIRTNPSEEQLTHVLESKFSDVPENTDDILTVSFFECFSRYTFMLTTMPIRIAVIFEITKPITASLGK
jgi:hypothetical protein